MNTIINFTPTGVIPTKVMTPYVPLSISEIVEDVHKAYELGITIVHLHIRDAAGRPTLSANTYGILISKIRSFAPDLIICISLSSRSGETIDRRIESLYLTGTEKPDMASLSLTSMNFVLDTSTNTPKEIKKLANVMRRNHILPELEVFDIGAINYSKYLIKKKILGPKNYFNILLGNISSAQSNLLHAGMMINDLPDKSYCSLAGIGDAVYISHLMALASNSGIRVGIEDNIWFDKHRTKLATNMELLTRVHSLIQMSDNKVMSSKELRTAILN